MEATDPDGDALISAFYEAALDRTRWEAALAQFAQCMDAEGAAILLGDLSLPMAQVCHTCGNDPAALAAYNNYYCKLDPLTHLAVDLAPGRWFNDWRDCGRTRSPKTEYYADFARRFDLRANMGTLLLREGSVVAALSAQRSGTKGPFSGDDEERAARLFPHLARAATIAYRLDRLQMHAAMSAEALGRLSIPVLILDPDCRIVSANEPALAMCRSGAILSCIADRVTLKAAPASFGRAVAQAACERGVADILPVSCAAPGGKPAHAFVLPIAAHTVAVHFWQRPLALVVIPDEADRANAPASMLRDLFGLTPSECRVARLSSEGRKTADVADQLHVSLETARSQLKSVLAKTGARRQSELARLMSRLDILSIPENSAGPVAS